MQSREDFRSFVQGNWSGGTTWWEPTEPNAGSETYFEASLFDTWSQPGQAIPLNDVTTTTDSNIPPHGAVTYSEKGVPWLVADTTTTDATNHDIYEWTPGSDAFVRDTGLVGPANAAAPMIFGVVYNPGDGYIHGLAGPDDGTNGTGRTFRFDPDTTTEQSSRIGSLTLSPGSNIFLFDGKVCYYDGDALYYDNSGSATLIADDGLGRDFLDDPTLFDADQATTPIFVSGAMSLAIGTDRGIHYVKNVFTKEGPQARMFRVEVTDSGSYIRRPIGSLPVGLVALDVTFHMDSLLINCTPDWELLSQNKTTHPQIQMWHYTQGSIGAIGAFDKPKSTESPWCFLGADGPLVFVGSAESVWVYDSINGGLHRLFKRPTTTYPGVTAMAQSTDSVGDYVYIFLAEGYEIVQKKQWATDLRGGSWGSDDDYTLESNWFDFGIPNEDKVLRSMKIHLGEGGTADSVTYVQVKTNDKSNAWTTIDTISGASSGTAVVEDMTGDGISGHRFSYRIQQEYPSNPPNPVPVRSIQFKAISGEKVERWLLALDATEIENVEGVKQRPDTVYDNLVASAIKDGIVSFTDHFGKTTADATSAIDVRVDRVVLTQTEQGESLIQVLLTKVDV
ncbi:hypothetical protein [Porticoccus sp.]